MDRCVSIDPTTLGRMMRTLPDSVHRYDCVRRFVWSCDFGGGECALSTDSQIAGARMLERQRMMPTYPNALIQLNDRCTPGPIGIDTLSPPWLSVDSDLGGDVRRRLACFLQQCDIGIGIEKLSPGLGAFSDIPGDQLHFSSRTPGLTLANASGRRQQRIAAIRYYPGVPDTPFGVIAQRCAIPISSSRYFGQSCRVSGSKSAPFGQVKVPKVESSTTALKTCRS